MRDFQIILAALTSIILFVFGLENFSKEVQKITGERFRSFLAKATQYSGIGVLIGAVITAFIQSSSATSIIAISLVNAGVLSFKNSIGIIFGANVGTTITAQLVAFKLTEFAPYFIIIGSLLAMIRSRYSVFAKSLFYFGFVFFSLNLISSTLEPLKSDARLIEFLSSSQTPLLGVLMGCVVTAIVQSSSVTTGLAIIFTQQGLMSLENAIPILMGANLGTTVTALLSIISMDISAKKTALAHFLFNVGGVILFLPLIYIYQGQFHRLSEDPAIALANFHFIFNAVTTLAFVLALNPFARFIDKILGEGKMDFERFDLSGLKDQENFEVVEQALYDDLNRSYLFVQENYNLVTLSIETNYRGVYEAAKKRVEYLDYFKSDLLTYFSNFISSCHNEEHVEKMVHIMSLYEYIFQIHDSVIDLTEIKESMDNNYTELKSDILVLVRELTSSTLSFFESMAVHEKEHINKHELHELSHRFQKELVSFNKKILKLMAMPERKDAAIILHIVTISQRLKDKLVNYHNLLTSHLPKAEEQIALTEVVATKE